MSNPFAVRDERGQFSTPQAPVSPLERFGAKVAFGPGCWVWMGAKNRAGYGVFSVGKGTVLAHRFAVGPVPDGLQLDHLCRNRACVRPSHLEAVTGKVNMERSGPARRTHCPAGHLYDAANTKWSSRGWRQCRTCANAGSRLYRLRKKEATA